MRQSQLVFKFKWNFDNNHQVNTDKKGTKLVNKTNGWGIVKYQEVTIKSVKIFDHPDRNNKQKPLPGHKRRTPLKMPPLELEGYDKKSRQKPVEVKLLEKQQTLRTTWIPPQY